MNWLKIMLNSGVKFTKHQMSSLLNFRFAILNFKFRELEINNVPKFYEVIFSLDKAKNADDA